MADDGKKFDLELGTKADTTGLDATERALRDVEQAGKDAAAAVNPMSMRPDQMGPEREPEEIERQADAIRDAADATKKEAEALDEEAKAAEDAAQAQRELDVERAKANQSAREQAEHNKRIEEGLRRLVALQLGQALSQVASNFRGINQEIDLSVDMIDAMSAGLASGNPYVALGAAALSAGKAIANARKEAQALIDEGKRNVEESARQLREAVEQQRIDKSKNFLARFLKEGLADIDKAYADLVRLKDLAESRRSADDSDREAAQQNALRAGAGAGGVARADLLGDLRSELAALQDQIDLAAARADAEQKKANKLAADLAQKEAAQTYDEAAIDDARAKAEEAQATADLAKNTADAAVTKLGDRLREVLNEYNARVQEGVDAEAARQLELARSVVQAIETSGAQLSATQKDALERTKQAAADGTFTAQEQQQFATDLQGSFSTIRGSLTLQKEILDASTEALQGHQEEIAGIKVTMDQLVREVNKMKQQRITPLSQ